MLQRGLALGVILITFLFCISLVHVFEERMNTEIENAGMQLTAHTNDLSTAQVFMNGRWYAERNMETLLVMGIDGYGSMMGSDAYNNSVNQTDFLALYLRDTDTGRTALIHLNRDTMTDIMTYGITGEPTGTRHAQLALAYNYGGRDSTSSVNVVSAVEHLLYGIEIDHYITASMDSIPILNDWADGVTIEVLDDFTGIDEGLIQGKLVKLTGQQALNYVRVRKGMNDSTNLHRMERQRQYASAWIKSAQAKLSDKNAVADLVMKLDDYYQSNCTIEQLAAYAESLGNYPTVKIYEIEGNAVQGETYMEFHVDEQALQQLVLELFYVPVE